MNNSLKQVIRVSKYILNGIEYHLAGNFFTPKPKMVQFPVCDRCNAKCIMCNRWQKDTDSEISTQKIREVFTNELFFNVEEVHLHGGEPTLRRDLAEICEIIQGGCPKMERLWISTNGFGPKRIQKRVTEILRILNFQRLNSLDINVSIDGLEKTHDKIRGVKGGFMQAIETIQVLKELAHNYPIQITIGTVIQPLNLDEVDQLEDLASRLGVPINFQPLMFDKFFNIHKDLYLRFSQTEMSDFKAIIETKLSYGSSTTSSYWCDLLSMMNGSKRKNPCAFDRYVFSLYPTGEVLPCSKEDWIIFGNVHENTPDKIWFSQDAKKIRGKMKKEVCPTCTFYCGAEYSLRKEFFTYLAFYLKKLSSSLAKSSNRKL